MFLKRKDIEYFKSPEEEYFVLRVLSILLNRETANQTFTMAN
jgi:hypothetical protein